MKMLNRYLILQLHTLSIKNLEHNIQDVNHKLIDSILKNQPVH